MVGLEVLSAKMVVEADEVQHRSALGQMHLDGTCCSGSISYASVRANPKMSPCHGCACESSGIPADQFRH